MPSIERLQSLIRRSTESKTAEQMLRDCLELTVKKAPLAVLQAWAADCIEFLQQQQTGAERRE